MTGEQNKNKEPKKETLSPAHEEALAAISKHVEEKLSRLAERSYEEEMERRLAEITEKRRKEKEELERQRSMSRAEKKGRRRGRLSLKREKPDEPVEEAQLEFAFLSAQNVEAAPEPEKEAEPKLQSEFDTEPEPVSEPEQTTEQEPEIDRKAEPETEIDREPEQEQEAEAKPVSEPEQEAETEPVSEPDTEIEIETESEPEQEAETAPTSEPDFTSEPVQEPEAEAKETEEKKKPETGSGAAARPRNQKKGKLAFRFLQGVKSTLIGVGHITKALHVTRRDMKEEVHLTHEKRMARYGAVWAKYLRPLTERCLLVWNWVQIKSAQFVVFLEEKKEKALLRLSLFGARMRTEGEILLEKAFRIIDYAEHHKLRIFSGFLGVVCCICVAAIVISNLVAYEYLYNGRVLGVVRDQDLVYKTIDVIGDKLAESLEADVEIDKEEDITFRKVIGWNLSIDSKDDVLNSITYMRSLKAKGYAIMVDDKQEAILQSREAAEGLLEDFKNRFSQAREGVEYESIAFAENVRIEEIETELGELENPDEVMSYLLTGAVEKKVHVVKKGETFNAIAESYGLTPAELQQSNPGVDPGRLKIEQQLVLTQDAPVLTIQTTEISTYIAEIPFETVNEETSNKYKGEKSVKQKGQNGQREVVAEIVRNNGVEVSRTELSSKTLKEPVKQVMLVGTKEKPKTVATGKFSYPVRGARLTSKFGKRWGRTHNGIDLAIAKGTTISAADGGTVTFAGYKGSFGYLVIINHGNGMETYYAHCSKLLVSRGTKVYKGQAIAKVGSTGRSTGPHCHFEIHVNGTPRNPLNYL